MNGHEQLYEANHELGTLCAKIRELVNKREYANCEVILDEAMQKYPHAPHPHNLYGLVSEARGDHPLAMNHFRAAWALDTTYKPALHNLDYFGWSTPISHGISMKQAAEGKQWTRAYDENDCINDDNKNTFVIERDAGGIGRVISNKPREIKYYAHGKGLVTKEIR